MLSFASDYIEGAHPVILQRLIETNYEQLSGYGTDVYCQSAAAKIRQAAAAPDADVFFLVGGTQTNRIVIASMLGDCEGVISAVSGHINLHEAGAVESTGHKVLGISGKDGKLDAADVEKFISAFYADENHEHMIFPGMVYISHPTEYGTLYSLSELEALSAVCRAHDIPLFLDGARLGYGLAGIGTDVTLPDVARLCDAFYVGETKVGALCGEAVVFPRHGAPKHFMTFVKQQGAMLAKGRLLGIQFDVLFTDDLYLSISRHAIEMAKRLCAILHEKGYPFFLESPTNQQFIILENEKMRSLSEKVTFSYWEPYDATHTVVRFATGWATKPEAIDALREIL